MKSRRIGKSITASLLALVMTLLLLAPLSFTGAEALSTNTQFPQGGIIAGSDFSEFSDVTELINTDADFTALRDSDGDVYMTFYHPSETSFSVLSHEGNCFIRSELFHVLSERRSSGISLSLTGKLGAASVGAAGDFVTDISVRYPDFVYPDAPCELDLIGLSGTYRGEDTCFSPVKMDISGRIIYYNGTEYTDSGIMLTEHQWKNISVAWHFAGTAPVIDIYINQKLVTEGVRVQVDFDTIDSADAVYYSCAASSRSMRADIDYFWVYSGTEPQFGLYPGADPASLTAELDLSMLEDGRIYSENVKNDTFLLSPLGNMFQVLYAGKNRYLAVNHMAYRPFADIYSQKATIGTSQVAETAVRIGSSWNGEATLLAPFSTDESGITKRVELVTLDSEGSLRLKSSGALLGSVGSDTYTVISLVISYDRAFFDVYIDGRAAVLGEALPAGLDKIDGVRIFGIESAAVSAGSVYIDYGVMYSGAVPAGAEDGTEVYYENTFVSADDADIAPLTAEGIGVTAEKSGDGYRLTYLPSSAPGTSESASLYLPITKSSVPIYADFVFSYNKLSSDIVLVSFTDGGEDIYTAAAVDKDGTLYAFSGEDKRSGIKLIAGKSYRITVVGSAENGYAGVYVNGSPEICFNMADNLNEADGMRFLSAEKLGNSKLYLNELSVYRSYRKLGAQVSDPELNFTAETTQSGDIHIEWESVGPAAKYTVWRSTSELAPQTKICELTDSLSFTDINVTENRTYYYTVCITYLKEGKEYYYGYGEKLFKITAVLPPEPEKPKTPVGELPAYTAITVIYDDFSDDDTKLRLGSDKCYIENSTQTLKLLNESGSMDIPYFSVESVGSRRAAIFDFELTVNKNTVSVNLASIYSDARKVTDIVKLSGEKLTLSDGTGLCTLQKGKSHRFTVWIDADCASAAVFIDGECVASKIDIPKFAKTDNAYAMRFCSVIGEASVSVDDFSYLETRAFISDYTANPLSPHVSVRGDGNSIMWDNVRGCKYFTLWSCGSADGKYTVLADNLRETAYTDSGVTSSRYYKVTYTFDTLGVELSVPLSVAAAAERVEDTGSSVRPFLDFGNTGSLYTFIISVVGILAIAALLVPFNFRKKDKEDNSADD